MESILVKMYRKLIYYFNHFLNTLLVLEIPAKLIEWQSERMPDEVITPASTTDNIIALEWVNRCSMSTVKFKLKLFK